MASNIGEVNSDGIISEIKNHVLNGDESALLSIIDKESFKKNLQTDSLDLIRIICQLLSEKEERKHNFFENCQLVISTVVENGYPEEILLELIEQAECTDDEIFITLVKPMQRVLLRIPEKQSQSLEWVLNTIHRFIYSIPFPEDYKLEEEQQLLLENDDSVLRLTCLYHIVLDFYTPFVAEAINNKSLEKTQLKHILLQSFIHLLGKPVTVLDLTVHKSKSEFRLYVEKIINWIVTLSNDILVYLMSVEKHLDNSRKKYDFKVNRDIDDHYVNSDMTIFEFVFHDKFPIDAVGIFYYMVLFENFKSDKLPCVYSAQFLFENCLYFSLVLIEISHSSAQFKGLLLAESLLHRIDDSSITYEALESAIHTKFFEILSKNAVYNEVENIRKRSVKIISLCFKKYDCKSKYIILYNVEKFVNHSGLLGYFITFIKDIVVSMLNSHSDLYIQYFSGKRLFDLMVKYSILPNGVESDLIDIADKVISSLNLIRFLVLRDVENISGIWDYVNKFEELLFTPLHRGLILSRPHYELKVKELKEKNYKSVNTKMSVTVGKEELGAMSKEDEISVMYSALNAFDLIESILTRVNECITIRNKI